MCEREFCSILAPYLSGFVKQKREMGLSYETEEIILLNFDRYCAESGLRDIHVDQTFVNTWLCRRETEQVRAQNKRLIALRQFLLYMRNNGIYVYIPRQKIHVPRAIIYIFTNEEIHAFFQVADTYQPGPRYACLANEYRVLFRVLLCCGLRNGEASGIAMENVDLDKGILTILKAKGNVDRLVYMPDDLVELCREYKAYLIQVLGYEPRWFFPSGDPMKPLPTTSVDAKFRSFWEKTAYAGKHEKHPVVHCLRHAFVYNKMTEWAGKDIKLAARMPYLSAYLGHKSENETIYYYHNIERAADTMHRKDTVSPNVIPEVTRLEEDK